MKNANSEKGVGTFYETKKAFYVFNINNIEQSCRFFSNVLPLITEKQYREITESCGHGPWAGFLPNENGVFRIRGPFMIIGKMFYVIDSLRTEVDEELKNKINQVLQQYMQ